MKNKTFEYIILKIVEWYMESKQMNSIESFNKANDFGLNKILLLPHFVCKASNESLFKIFDNLIPDTIGICDLDLKNEYLNRSSNTMPFFGPYAMICNEDKTITQMIEYQQQEFIENQTLILTLDAAINTLKKINTLFPTLTSKELGMQSKEHDSWQRYYPLLKGMDSTNAKFKELIAEFNYAVQFDMSYYAHSFKDRITT